MQARDEMKEKIHNYIEENGLEILGHLEEDAKEDICEHLLIFPSQYVFWTILNGRFIGYMYSLGLVNRLRAEGFNETEIANEAVYIKTESLDRFLELLTPNDIKNQQN